MGWTVGRCSTVDPRYSVISKEIPAGFRDIAHHLTDGVVNSNAREGHSVAPIVASINMLGSLGSGGPDITDRAGGIVLFLTDLMIPASTSEVIIKYKDGASTLIKKISTYVTDHIVPIKFAAHAGVLLPVIPVHIK